MFRIDETILRSSQMTAAHGHQRLASSTIVNPNRISSRFLDMTRLHTISPRNTMAISAMLMLSAGMAHAQDVTVPVTDAPVVVTPVPTLATPSAAPTIVIPTVAPEPVAAPATAVPAPATPVRAEPAPTRRAATRAEPPSAAPSNEASAPVGPVAQPATPAPVAEEVPAAPPSAATPAVTQETSDNDWAVPVGAAATLLVVGGAALAMRRRRRPYEEDLDFVPPVVTRPASGPERRISEPLAPPRPTEPTFGVTPARMATPTEREALIERIVASPPDSANPFTSRKARRRRARIMVQSMAARSDVPMAATSSTHVAPERADVRPEYAHA